MTGLETSLSLGLTYLVEAGHLSLTELLKVMTSNPSYLVENVPADLVIFADKEKRQVTADFKSKAANSPFVGEELTGSVKYTICDGEIVYQA